ncbi:MAG: PHB depolymerase family esterase [Saprospiraceae bacterium]|nr:PHB depolymerase family esterase [Saprospiraceae bacterium]
MRKLFLVLLFNFLCLYMFGQQTLTKNIQHDGMDRSYIIYIPESYNASSNTPLLLNFHGYTSNATEQMVYGDFRKIADEEGFIVVHPEGTLFNGQTHWNVGGWTLGSTVDDVGFTDQLIDEIAIEYSIDLDRIYATGMSNGGFMSFLLACQLSNRIAAIASVTGSMTPSIFNNCDPQHSTPVLYIHGTSDNVVPYTGALWTKDVEDVLEYWGLKNECDEDAVLSSIPNNDTSDGSTVEVISYLNGISNTEVVHYKVIDGGHTWPGTLFNTPGTNQDFDASEAIWEFLSQFDINGRIDMETSLEEPLEENATIQIFPNPSSSFYSINFDKIPSHLDYTLSDPLGRIIKSGVFNNKNEVLDLTEFASGNYLLQIGRQQIILIKTD